MTANYVLVLTTGGDESDLVGIWGPYTSQEMAQRAQDELSTWPIDGVWQVVKLKAFTPASSGGPHPYGHTFDVNRLVGRTSR